MNILSDEEIEKLIEEGKKMNENDLKLLNERNINYENNDLVEEIILNLSLGIELKNGEMKKIIPRNSIIPFKESFLYDAEINNNKILLKIYQGERILAIGNNLLKIIEIDSNDETKFVKLEIIFELNENLILKIISKNNGEIISNVEIKINYEFKENDIKDQLKVAKKMEKNEINIINRNNSKFELLQFTLKIMDKVNEALKWIEYHQNESREEYIKQLENFKKYEY